MSWQPSDDPERLAADGAAAFRRKDFITAGDCFARLLALRPRDLAAAFNLGRVYEVEERFDEAAAAYHTVLAIKPHHVDALVRLGIVRYVQERYDDADAAFGAALQIDPLRDEAALNRAIIANVRGRVGEAIAVLEPVVARSPGAIPVRIAYADSLRQAGRLDAAAAAAEDVLALEPMNVQALVLRGQLAYDAGDVASAETLLREAVALAPDRHEPALNLAVLLHGLGRADEAVEYGRRAVAGAPDDPVAHVNLGMSLLLAGDYPAGWAEMNWRMRDPRTRTAYPYLGRLPVWDGPPLAAPLLVSYDQGFGDMIAFARLLPLAAKRAPRLVVEAPRPIVALLKTLDVEGELIPGRIDPAALDGFAAHVPICSLGDALGITAATLPAAVPYLHAEPARVQAYRARFAALGKRRAIGLTWAGDPSHPLDRFRSIPLERFAPLAELDDVLWVALQVGPRGHDSAPPGMTIGRLGTTLRDFGDTAAAIAALDLVITVDTAVAHVAGALGAPVWMLSGFGSFWMWGTQGPATPWYPSMRIFRQRTPARWDETILEVRSALG